jgi:hypothetical protein
MLRLRHIHIMILTKEDAFGLGPVPEIFTKLFQQIISFPRQRGLQLVIYLDDILVILKNQPGNS